MKGGGIGVHTDTYGEIGCTHRHIWGDRAGFLSGGGRGEHSLPPLYLYCPPLEEAKNTSLSHFLRALLARRLLRDQTMTLLFRNSWLNIRVFKFSEIFAGLNIRCLPLRLMHVHTKN